LSFVSVGMASPIIQFEFPWPIGSLSKEITLNTVVRRQVQITAVHVSVY